MQQAIWQHKGPSKTKAGQPIEQVTAEQVAAANNSRLLAQLLLGRGLNTPDEIEAFLNLEAYTPTSGFELPDAQVGLERLIKAIDEQENILVYGDFDVDGQTGTSILYKTLQHLGGQVSFYIPDRATEGHGLNATAVCKLVSSRQVKLLITTDTGITDFNEVSLLNGLGVDTIVTDHHDLPENLPPALANINPKCLDDPDHPMYNLCGAGVAYKLCELLLTHYEKTDILDELLAIAAIGTVVDMMPLVRENRWMVWAGLRVLNRRELLGVEALLSVAGFDEPKSPKNIQSETIGFVIGPRLNALGRLERADNGVHLLLADTMDEATRIAQHLDALNRKRQEMCEATVLEAEQFLARTGGLNGEKAIVLASPQWHPGIIGLVATRLKDRYNVPVFLMIVDEAKGEVRCSARSIRGFHLYNQLNKLSDYFLHFGGHAGAGGFALMQEKLPAFKKELLALARQVITDDMCRPTIEIDAQTQWHQLTPGLLNVLSALEPTGQGNPSPVLETEPLRIAAHRWMGERNDHLKMVLEPTEGKPIPEPLDAICWRAKERYAPTNGDVGRFVFSPSLNTYQGRESFQLMVEDMAFSGAGAGGAGGINVTPKRELLSEHNSSEAVEQPAGPLGQVVMKNQKPSEKGASLEYQGHDRPELSASSSPVSAPLMPEGSREGQDGFGFVDHRHRNDPSAMASQLLTQPNTRLFYEGVEPLTIPFFNAQDALTRGNLVQARELMFWSVPPSEKALYDVLRAVQPETVHCFFGTETLCDLPTPREALAKVYRWAQQYGQTELHQSAEQEQSDSPLSLELETASIALGTTSAVILAGLMVLQRIGVVRLGAYDLVSHSVEMEWVGAGSGGHKQDVQTLPEMGAFAHALNEQRQATRRWRTVDVSEWYAWAQREGLSSFMAHSSLPEVSTSRRPETLGVS